MQNEQVSQLLLQSQLHSYYCIPSISNPVLMPNKKWRGGRQYLRTFLLFSQTCLGTHLEMSTSSGQGVKGIIGKILQCTCIVTRVPLGPQSYCQPSTQVHLIQTACILSMHIDIMLVFLSPTPQGRNCSLQKNKIIPRFYLGFSNSLSTFTK